MCGKLCFSDRLLLERSLQGLESVVLLSLLVKFAFHQELASSALILSWDEFK